MTAIIDTGSFVRPYPGYRVSGDAVFIKSHDQGIFVCIIDAMGHGPDAANMAHRILDFLEIHWSINIESCLAQLNESMRGSLGAAVGMAFIYTEQQNIVSATIGNTKLRVVGDTSTWGIASDGILGQYKRSIKLSQLNFQTGDLILLYSDGLPSFFSMGEYRGNLKTDECDLITRNIIHQFGKAHDDASCIALRYLK
jgi:phosphoserine phosphatase RsbX